MKMSINTSVDITVITPTLTLSDSGNFDIMTFTITSNVKSGFTAFLYSYTSESDAENAPPNGKLSSGQLLATSIPISNGIGAEELYPSSISTYTQYWVAVYEDSGGSIIRSNVLMVIPPPVSPSLAIDLNSAGTFDNMEFRITSDNTSNFTVFLCAYSNPDLAQFALPLGDFPEGLIAFYDVSMSGGSGTITQDLSVLSPYTQFWIAVYAPSDTEVVRSNILEISPPSVPTSSTLTISNTGTFEQMMINIVATNPESDYFTVNLYAYSNKISAEITPPEPTGAYSALEIAAYNAIVSNGVGAFTVDPNLISSGIYFTQYWVAVYEKSDGAIVRSNVLTITSNS